MRVKSPVKALFLFTLWNMQDCYDALIVLPTKVSLLCLFAMDGISVAMMYTQKVVVHDLPVDSLDLRSQANQSYPLFDLN
ncbi:hypothetical protein [Magnetococcus sp. PR-3]|uniref:hypothetical protein n=1 Tax=Magnetococcus sp. PR-3 TaxID=3120355 RepID=UPI002FCE39C2